MSYVADPFTQPPTEFRVKTPRFKIGDRVYLAVEHNPLYLRDEPSYILGYVLIPKDCKANSHDPHKLRNAILIPAYITSWDWNAVPEDLIFASKEAHKERFAVELAGLRADKAAKAKQDRIDKYKKAKQVVTDFEADYFASVES